MAVVSCGGGGAASFTVSNFVINPTNAQVGDKVDISLTVTNGGEASGNYNVDLTVDGTPQGSQTVDVAAGASTIVAFNYTPEASGTFTIVIESLAGPLSGSLIVTPSTGYWEIPYKVVTGSWISMDISIGGITPLHRQNDFNESSGIRFTMLVNKSVVNGAREVIIPAETWSWPIFFVPAVLPGIDMNLDMPLSLDAHGTLYVQDGIGDVDLNSVSTAGHSPIQEYTYGDGTKDPAGSMLIPMDLVGHYVTPIVPKGGNLPFGCIFDTAHTENVIESNVNKKMDGRIVTDDGAPFLKDGGVAPYVGTSGTMVMTGTGDCLGAMIVGFRMDCQLWVHIVVEPVD